MVTIITGKINSGKSTTLHRLYDQCRKGDGFIAVKKMIGDDLYGFHLTRLSSSDTLPWMIHQSHYHDDFVKVMKFGPYYVNLNVLSLVEETVDDFLEDHITPIYIDEVGKLELSGGGYHNVLRQILKSGADLFIAVRDDLVDSILAYFEIKDYELIQAQREE